LAGAAGPAGRAAAAFVREFVVGVAGRRVVEVAADAPVPVPGGAGIGDAPMIVGIAAGSAA
jgi:hypothetical protein